MDALYEYVVRPWLFRQRAEEVHDLVLDWMENAMGAPWLLKRLSAFCGPVDVKPFKCFGLSFPTPVGLAAGFDKDARVWPMLAALGFGHLELGTVTRHAQNGNEKPRIFRYPESEALVNRMGFPNEGAEHVARRLRQYREKFPVRCPIGVNIGKSRGATLEEAAEDYVGSFEILAPLADYIAINVSSPNTVNLRRLQERDALRDLLNALQLANSQREVRRPILLKISPDLGFRELDDVLDVCFETGVDGLIATNTVVNRPEGAPGSDQTGGLSGRPINERAAEVIRYVRKTAGARFPIVGVGGVVDHVTAGRLMDAGATMVQLYTGLVYRGPFFARDLGRQLRWRQLEWV